MSQIMTNLAESPQFFEQSIELIERSLNYSKKYTYKDDFCILYRKDNLKNCHLLIENNRVVANICALPCTLSDGEFETPVCFFGGLCSDETIRGTGRFKQFFEDILLKEQNYYSMYMLWSNLTDFYRKFGFYEAGTFFELQPSQIKKENLRNLIKTDTLSYEEKIGIKKLYQKSYKGFFTPKRTDSEWELLFKHPSMDIYLEKNGDEIRNYLIAGKGMDLGNTVHESSGVILPHDTELVHWSPFPTPHAIKKYLAFLRINENQHSRDFIHNISGGEMSLLGIGDSVISFKLNEVQYNLDNEDFLSGLFGPAKLKEFDAFKCDLWIPGFESI